MRQAQRLLYTFFCSSIFMLVGAEVIESSSHKITKLFVFGDSYADTGNTNMSENIMGWKEPYGITFPGTPSGRASDGLLLTDYIASFLGLKSPVPYEQRYIIVGKDYLEYGMNFAFGGTGVLDTTPHPTMTTQIDYLEELLKASIYTPSDLQSSVAHVSCVGNDYLAYLRSAASLPGFLKYIHTVVDQLMVNIQRLQSLGVKKISVTGLQPLGCIPSIVAISSKKCNDLYNLGVQYHNFLLHRRVSELNKQTTQDNDSTIVIIELYDAFNSVFQQTGSLKFYNPYEACCAGINSKTYCGLVDEKGNKLYTLCEDRSSYLFWDGLHPTQAGWEALMPFLKPNLEELLD